MIAYTLYHSIDICCLMENKSKKENVVDQRKLAISLQADTDGFYLTHTVFFFFFNILINWKYLKISKCHTKIQISGSFLKKLKDLAT